MKTPFVMASLALLCASGMASANDIYVDAGVLPVSPAAPYGHLFVHDLASFTDTIDFVVNTGSLGASANALNVQLRGLDLFDIQGLTYSVYGGMSGDNTVWYGTFPGNNISYDIGLNMPGAYHMIVTGMADGVYGGAYGVALVSGVPEPEMLGMMLAGMGVLGVVLRQKKLAKKAA